MLLLITWVKFRVQKYSYFLHLQNYIAVFYNFFFGTIIDNSYTCRADADTHA